MKTVIKSIFILALIMFAAQTSQAGPQMKIEPPTFDFGYVPQQAKVTHQFWLKSVGDDMLKIISVKPGCGCTKAPLDKKEIVVGDSARLEIIFDTKKYKGKMMKSTRIQTNAEEKPVMLRFSARGITDENRATLPIMIDPPVLRFDPGDTDNGGQLQFKITNKSDQDIEFKIIDSPERWCKVQLPPTISPGQTASGRVTLRNTETVKKFAKSFTIELNDKRKTRFTMPLVGNSGEVGGK
ncbi:MAG: DUF1573 domain-containing protein [FCB group bacterium]|nr:DUF1573 domain-containing protein [FCB group bacterium]